MRQAGGSRFSHAAIAAQSAFEGDAMYFGMLSMGVGPLPQPETFDAEFQAALDDSSDALAAAPALLRGLVGFPYAQGYRLAALEGVHLLEDPPASTEQAMHAERRREPFSAFDLEGVSAMLPDGCEAVTENTVGELQLSILLQDLAVEEVAPEVWEGWDGDRYLAARCTNGPALLWLTSWDSGDDAEEFARAYARLASTLVARVGFAEPLRVHRRGREVVIWSASWAGVADSLDGHVARARVRSLSELREVASSP